MPQAAWLEFLGWAAHAPKACMTATGTACWDALSDPTSLVSRQGVSCQACCRSWWALSSAPLTAGAHNHLAAACKLQLASWGHTHRAPKKNLVRLRAPALVQLTWKQLGGSCSALALPSTRSAPASRAASSAAQNTCMLSGICTALLACVPRRVMRTCLGFGCCALALWVLEQHTGSTSSVLARREMERSLCLLR